MAGKNDHQEKRDLPSCSYDGESRFGASSLAKRIKTREVEAENQNQKLSILKHSSAPIRALQNSVILQNIFKFLSLDDLQSCRSVDLPFWSSEAGHAIDTRRILHITLSHMKDMEITIVKTRHGQKGRLIFQNLVHLTAELEKFVEKRFKIRLTIQKRFEGLLEFIKKFAKLICALDFYRCMLDNVGSTEFQKLLQSLQNLTNMTMTTVPFINHQTYKDTWDPSILVPQVTTVSFADPFSNSIYIAAEFIEDFFKVFPNLKNVEGFPIECISRLTADEHLQKVKSFHVPNETFNGQSLEKKLTKFANISQGAGLQKLYLCPRLSSAKPDVWESYCKSWSTILRNNQNTLEYLKIEPLPSPGFLEYPEMKAVKKICLLNSRSKNKNKRDLVKTVEFFAPGFDVSKTFPNLVEVSLEGLEYSFEEFFNFFPEDARSQIFFKGVSSLSLEFKYFAGPTALEKVGRFFPDVTRFFMDSSVRWLEADLPVIAQIWPKLASLKLKVEIPRSAVCRATSDAYLLDPVFTGFSAAACAGLRSHREKIDLNLDIYRETLGISTMAELKELTLIFYGHYAKTRKVIPLFSHVTPFYGFQYLPRLKVTCSVPWDCPENDKIRRMLAPIEDYVIFNPNYY